MHIALTNLLPPGSRAIFPLWVKLLAATYLCIFIYYGWTNYGLQYFLWYSCIGVIGTVTALWLENHLLASMILLSTFMADELGWGGDFLVRLLFGWHPFGATNYMFDHSLSKFGRALSLYHFVVPALLVWMVYKLRYDSRAFKAQALLSSVILLLSFTLTNPVNNINWVFGFGTKPQTYVPGYLYLLAEMVAIPIVFYLPVHLLLRWLGWHLPKQTPQAVQNAAQSD